MCPAARALAPARCTTNATAASTHSHRSACGPVAAAAAAHAAVATAPQAPHPSHAASAAAPATRTMMPDMLHTPGGRLLSVGSRAGTHKTCTFRGESCR